MSLNVLRTYVAVVQTGRLALDAEWNLAWEYSQRRVSVDGIEARTTAVRAVALYTFCTTRVLLRMARGIDRHKRLAIWTPCQRVDTAGPTVRRTARHDRT